ncbi:MAG: hypothetical protein A2445_00665 [Candidatus Jacksonbacteria bacterium RIFOXYC2_FULL_44_29]|nr:MAG: hypothetical protein UW45_C0010G0010 [Parcubacteria group bacterium GW2011_GWC2_44_22]OGY76068.1 MAG: hypothetical protein A2295_03880 [Candidatus Jacksonbacteria bacterium RIFOXYB2_FULL_44_15]OGY76371.1 MAG: hypothetical protein A2240_04395 [Candidatus Jacksonbacteria bacterium RIFOXYA2_FULL_43_12]OGY78009.1 MAG: hypothetical protein A2445_00665 [Candidatus Jacksonbacteria bacterium RIFOXYC2_FULL_44_29]OGY80319.1 MAG: hypothetical protein A2550_04420 [Candidatus Jacksonbacteria bacteri
MPTTIQKATSRGQITLPAAWRKKFNTDTYLLKWNDDTLQIFPIDVQKLSKEVITKDIKDIF